MCVCVCVPYRLIHVRQCVRVNNENQAMTNIDKQIQTKRSHKRFSRAATQTARGSIPGGNSVKTELNGKWGCSL